MKSLLEAVAQLLPGLLWQGSLLRWSVSWTPSANSRKLELHWSLSLARSNSWMFAVMKCLCTRYSQAQSLYNESHLFLCHKEPAIGKKCI